MSSTVGVGASSPYEAVARAGGQLDPIDFDGRFWKTVGPLHSPAVPLQAGETTRLKGVVTLATRDHATFTDSSGNTVGLQVQVVGCA